jgi:ParB family chromosome partitioning protein
LKSSVKNISLNSYDDIFSTEETREDAKREKVMNMPLSELHPFPDHPFQVRDDDSMKDTVESIKEYGVLVPAIVRPRADGGYELISGHRRKHACELAGLPTMPVIVRNLDDDAATIIMVDSNIQRENILPSERAKAYKMKLDAIKRQAGRPSLENGGQVGHDLRGIKTRDLIAENSEDSARTIQRYIRLNELTPQLQQMVDDKKIAMTPAVELSYLKPEEQTLLLDTIESEQATPSLSQAQRLKNFSQEGHLNEDSMLAIMSEEKKPEKNDLTIKADKLQKYFPKSYTPQQMEQVIIRLLDGWQKKRQRDQER